MRQILCADMVLSMDAERNLFQPGCVVIEDDRIMAVGPQERLKNQVGQVVNLPGKLLMPGLVNAHTHTPMVLFRGIAEGHSLFSWEGWYNSIRRIEYVADSSMVPAAVAVSCAEMLRTGTTTFADQYFYMDQILPVVRQSGMRAVLSYGVVDEKNDEAVDRELANAAAFLEQVKDDPRIRGWMGPHALFEDNRVETIRKEVPMAERYQAGFHIHMLTNTGEDDYCRQHFGRSAAQMMIETGVLNHPVLAAHCVALQEADMPALAQTPFTAVICPSASMRSGAGAAPLQTMRRHGVNTALGTDNVANSNSYDLFREMSTAAKLAAHREGQPGAVSAMEIVEMATLGGARGMGLADQIGSLEPGKKADLISLDLNEIGWAPFSGQDVYTALVYGVSGQHVRDVMVDGRWLLRDAQWTTLDYPQARRELEAARRELQRRMDQE